LVLLRDVLPPLAARGEYCARSRRRRWRKRRTRAIHLTHENERVAIYFIVLIKEYHCALTHWPVRIIMVTTIQSALKAFTNEPTTPLHANFQQTSKNWGGAINTPRPSDRSGNYLDIMYDSILSNVFLDYHEQPAKFQPTSTPACCVRARAHAVSSRDSTIKIKYEREIAQEQSGAVCELGIKQSQELK
jgi:hypothetical protein